MIDVSPYGSGAHDGRERPAGMSQREREKRSQLFILVGAGGAGGAGGAARWKTGSPFAPSPDSGEP